MKSDSSMVSRPHSLGEDARTAFIISPQPWAGFKVSKHHYALALAREGWQVYFIDPPTPFRFARRVECVPTGVDGIQRVSYSIPVPSKIKRYARSLFDRAMWEHARWLTSVLGAPGLVWDFDNTYNFGDLRAFGAAKSIFFLVDRGERGMGDKHADYCFHLHPSFCEWAGFDQHGSLQLGHGVSIDFIQNCPLPKTSASASERLSFGMVGNLAAKWFDWDTVLEIARRHPTAQFLLWGPHPTLDQAGGALRVAMECSQFQFQGQCLPEEIAASSGEVDIWLAPFLNDAVPGGPLNSHKILEYLSTGKVVAMTWLEAWEGKPHVSMLKKVSNETLADLVDQVVDRLGQLNSNERCLDRMAYARARTYGARLETVMSRLGLKGRAQVSEGDPS